ncbi:MAG: DnaJ family domain-containing protein [Granulosicoccaceae bacterium]
MLLLDQLAEQKIKDHLARVEPGESALCGQALDLTVDAHVPSEVRALFRVLKHSGFVPPEVALRNEVNSLNQLLSCVTCEQERGRVARRLQVLHLQLESQGRSLASKPLAEYQEQLANRLDDQE